MQRRTSTTQVQSVIPTSKQHQNQGRERNSAGRKKVQSVDGRRRKHVVIVYISNYIYHIRHGTITVFVQVATARESHTRPARLPGAPNTQLERRVKNSRAQHTRFPNILTAAAQCHALPALKKKKLYSFLTDRFFYFFLDPRRHPPEAPCSAASASTCSRVLRGAFLLAPPPAASPTLSFPPTPSVGGGDGDGDASATTVISVAELAGVSGDAARGGTGYDGLIIRACSRMSTSKRGTSTLLENASTSSSTPRKAPSPCACGALSSSCPPPVPTVVLGGEEGRGSLAAALVPSLLAGAVERPGRLLNVELFALSCCRIAFSSSDSELPA